jgi:hypothetical protein
MSGPSIIQVKMKTKTTILKDSKITLNQQELSRVPSEHQLQEVEEEEEVLEGDSTSNQGNYSVYYVERTWGHTTRTCQVTIQKQKEIAEVEARQNQTK